MKCLLRDSGSLLEHFVKNFHYRGESFPSHRLSPFDGHRMKALSIESVWLSRRVFYSTLPTAPFLKKWLRGGRGREVFYSTETNAEAEQTLRWFSWRWPIEVTFHDSKQHLGFEQHQGWSRKAVERTAPLAMLLYSLIVLWFAREGHRLYKPLDCPCPFKGTTSTKSEPSFADMLTTLKRQSVRQKVLSIPGPTGARGA